MVLWLFRTKLFLKIRIYIDCANLQKINIHHSEHLSRIRASFTNTKTMLCGKYVNIKVRKKSKNYITII